MVPGNCFFKDILYRIQLGKMDMASELVRASSIHTWYKNKMRRRQDCLDPKNVEVNLVTLSVVQKESSHPKNEGIQDLLPIQRSHSLQLPSAFSSTNNSQS